METEREIEFGPTRAITVVLSEGEWRRLVAIEPHPVAWLRKQIQGRLEGEFVKAEVLLDQ